MSFITTPFSWLLLQLSNLFGNYGVALIVFGLVLALIQIPFTARSSRSTMKMGLLSGQMNKLKERHGENTPKYQEEVQKLYKEEGINPMSGCLWTLIPLIVVMILYPVVRQPLKYMMGLSEDQITQVVELLNTLGENLDTGSIWVQINAAEAISRHYDAVKAVVAEVINLNFNFLGLNISLVPSFKIWEAASWSGQQIFVFFLPIISALLAVVSQKLSTATSFNQQQQDANNAGMMKSMMFMGPLMSLWIGYSFPAAMSLYWLVQTLVRMVATFFTNIQLKKEFTALTKERDEKERIREAELEAKRQETARLKALNATKENRNTSKKDKKRLEKLAKEERLAKERKKDQPKKDTEDEPSRVGNRQYARGRAYDPDRYGHSDDIADDYESTEDEVTEEPMTLEAEEIAQNTETLEAHYDTEDTSDDTDELYEDEHDDEYLEVEDEE